MTQREFIDKLRAGLTGKVSAGTVQENVYYYEQYFAEEMRKGRQEQEICASLGAPQLIVKGILEAEKFQGDSAYHTDYSDEVHEEKDFRSTSSRWVENIQCFRVHGWMMMIVTGLIFFFVISLVISVFTALAPLILPICIVLFVVQIFKNNF